MVTKCGAGQLHYDLGVAFSRNEQELTGNNSTSSRESNEAIKLTVKEINFIVRNRSYVSNCGRRTATEKATPHALKTTRTTHLVIIRHIHHHPHGYPHPLKAKPSKPDERYTDKVASRLAAVSQHRTLIYTQNIPPRYRPTKLRISYHHSFVLPIRSCHVEKSCVRVSQSWSLVDSW